MFEEQSLQNYIPFRKLQFKYIDKIVSVSKRGEMYLKQQFPSYASKISTSYLGTNNTIDGVQNISTAFNIVTCSIIRDIIRNSIKRFYWLKFNKQLVRKFFDFFPFISKLFLLF